MPDAGPLNALMRSQRLDRRASRCAWCQVGRRANAARRQVRHQPSAVLCPGRWTSPEKDLLPRPEAGQRLSALLAAVQCRRLRYDSSAFDADAFWLASIMTMCHCAAWVATAYTRAARAARLARLFTGTWPLVIKTPPLPMEHMQQSMQWHKYRTQDPGLAWLRGLLATAAERMNRMVVSDIDLR